MKAARKRVFACGISHESHSFSKVLTTLGDFAVTGPDGFDPDAFRGTRSTEGGIVEAAQACGWDLQFPFFAHATSGGPLASATFEALTGALVDALHALGPVDGIVLALHGSMYAEHVPDCEGEILERVRAVIGPTTPIALSLDLHAKVTDRMAALANLLTSFRTTPHVDMYETSHRACHLLDQTMRGIVAPRLYVGRLPMLAGMDMGRTIDPDGPMSRLQAKARELEASGRVIDIALNAGFYYGDVAEAGPSVVVTGNGDDPAYQQIADTLIREAWDTREYVSISHMSVTDAVARARGEGPGPGPILLVDYTDGPAGGAYGDGTTLMRALLDADLPGTVIGPITDPEAVQAALAAGVGSSATLQVGGKVDPEAGGGPVRMAATVCLANDGRYVRKGPFSTGTVGEFGPSVLLEHGNCRVIVTSKRVQPEDREQYRIFGIDPEVANVIALKGINHFRADFEPIARSMHFVDSGCLIAVDFTRFPFQRVRRPIWPLDDILPDGSPAA